MDETTLKIAMAALIHDIGKFADKGMLEVTDQYVNDNAGLYLPFYNGRHSHHHAVYTAAFIEGMKDFLPHEFNSSKWGDGDAFINLAAAHHKPETPMQWIVAVADRVSSGWDRDTFDATYNRQIAWKDYKKTRLLPLFEQLSVQKGDIFEHPEDFSYCYPLEAVSPEKIFPGPKEKLQPKAAAAAEDQYRKLFDGFLNNLKHLKHKDTDLLLWLEHFESLMMLYTSAIPAARAGNVVPDVSLYDHSKMTSALATAIYLYHRDSETLSENDVRNYDDRKFLIVNGDFQGIQDFIFGKFSDSARYRSKILRGRSFAVSLLSELSADLLCRETGLPFTSVILNAAGKFTMLAPNTAKAREAVETVKTKINDWLFKVSFGQTVIILSAVEATCKEFVTGNFSKLWDEINLAMAEKSFESIDLRKYGGPVKSYLDSFVNEPDHPPLCPICGKRPSVRKVKGTAYVTGVQSACRLCRDHIFLGANLVKKNRLCVTEIGADLGGKEDGLFEPIFGLYQVSFLEKNLEDQLDALASKGHVIKYWNLSADPDEFLKSNAAVKFINGYVPKYAEKDEQDDRILCGAKKEEKKLELIDQIKSDEPKTLNHIACMALLPKDSGDGFQGMEALAVLKADVDHLALLMACGLKSERFTLSRLATLSRQLNHYFAVYLPHFLRTQDGFQDIYTVFAGGDDLFLIGPWNRIIALSLALEQSFSSYVCDNPEIRFSAGISIHKPHSPIDAMAGAAEIALESSKARGRNRLTLFSETVEWETAKELVLVRKTFEEWLDKGWISNVMFYRFNEFIRMAAREKQVVSNSEVHLEDMACTKWRAMLVYLAERNVAKQIKGDERQEVVRTVTQTMTGWLEKYESKLKVPVWNIMYNRR